MAQKMTAFLDHEYAGPLVSSKRFLRKFSKKHKQFQQGKLKKTRRLRLKAGTKITLTPINTVNPRSEHSAMAKNDYMVESKKFRKRNDEESPMWDDPGNGKARVGEWFAFCHNQPKTNGKDLAELFLIKSKKPHTERPENWQVPDHMNRDVIVLTRCLGTCSVTDLMVAIGWRKSRDEGSNCLRGTTRTDFKVDFQISME